MGSAACWQLARRGLRVLGIERFDIGHQMGSSHGFNRIIRLAYFEHPSYVPLLRRAYALWREAETLTRRTIALHHRLDRWRRRGQPRRRGLASSCREHGLAARTTRCHRRRIARFPGYRLPDGHMAVYPARWRLRRVGAGDPGASVARHRRRAPRSMAARRCSLSSRAMAAHVVVTDGRALRGGPGGRRRPAAGSPTSCRR